MVTPALLAAPMMSTPEVPTADEIRSELDHIPDPEIPGVSIVELGMIGRVDVNPAGIAVELLPTFVGCPALELIRTSIEDRLIGYGLPVQVDVSFSTPWSSDRISPSGCEKLLRSGFAPPPPVRAGRALSMATSMIVEPVPCPFCGSARTTLENVFGPTQCRSIRHCADCRQPFEAFKPV